MKKVALKTTLLSVIAFGLSFLPTKAGASQFIVDQKNDNFTPSLFQSIQTLSPIGQEFTPTLNSLDFVELFTQDFGRSNNPLGANLFVNIRSGDISGSILGTSDIVSLADKFSGITQFNFSKTVTLNPEQKYVIEAKFASGSDNWALGSSGGPVSTYPNGNLISTVKGVTTSNSKNDLWFREGAKPVSVPEPSILLGIGSVVGLVAFSNRKKLYNEYK